MKINLILLKFIYQIKILLKEDGMNSDIKTIFNIESRVKYNF